MSTSWRKSGFTFVKYVDVSTNALRGVVKQSSLPKFEKRSAFYFKKFTFRDGAQVEMKEHDSVAKEE